jgi:hypothetical protein
VHPTRFAEGLVTPTSENTHNSRTLQNFHSTPFDDVCIKNERFRYGNDVSESPFCELHLYSNSQRFTGSSYCRTMVTGQGA